MRTIKDKPVAMDPMFGDAWRVCQNTKNGSIAMCGLAVKRTSGIKVVEWRNLLALPTKKGVKLQRRYLLRAVLEMPNGSSSVIGVCHFPPQRYKSRRWVMEKFVQVNLIKWARKRRMPVALFCDNNEKPQRMANKFHMRTDGHNIMAWLWTPKFAFTKVRLDYKPKQAKWSDHPDAVAVRKW